MGMNPGDYQGQGGDQIPPQQPQYQQPGPPQQPQGGYGQPPVQQGYAQQPMQAVGQVGQVGYVQPAVVYGNPVALVQQKTNGLAVTGMVMGIISLVFFWAYIFGLIVAILAVIFSAAGISQTGKRNEGGKGMAIAGLVCGLIALTFWLILAITIASFLSSL